jgi:hypothetical protein
LGEIASRIDGLIGTTAASGLGDPQQRLSLHLRGDGDASDFKQSGGDIHEPYLRGHLFGGGLRFGQFYEERHVNRLIVEKDAVGILAVRAKALAMVRGHDHCCVRLNLLLL